MCNVTGEGQAIENIDDEFKSFNHWLVWKAVRKDNGKLDKVPYDPKTGKRASTTDSRTWAPFSEALEALETGRYSGLGFVFSSGDPFVGLDFDDCRNSETGEVDSTVLEYIKKFEDRYVEVSVSGALASRVNFRESHLWPIRLSGLAGIKHKRLHAAPDSYPRGVSSGVSRAWQALEPEASTPPGAALCLRRYTSLYPAPPGPSQAILEPLARVLTVGCGR